MKFRPLNNLEREVIRKAGKDYGLNVDTALKGKKLIISSGRKEVFATNKLTVKIIEKMNKEPYCAGLFIGEIRKNRFELSLEGAYLFAPFANKKIIIDDKAEQLVLYGRDVFSNSIVSSPKLKEGERCIILNKFGDALAIGEVKGGTQVSIRNIKDRGWYLRRGR
jgi:ribosome biogenesis protein Nip4